MPLPFRPASLLLLAALTGAAGMAWAAPQQRRDPAPVPQAEQEARRAPPQRQDWSEARRPSRQDRQEWTPPRRSEDALSDSVRRVEQRTRGQVLSAERVPYDGRNLNRIKVVDERGRVRVYMDDPQQGSPKAAETPPTRDNDD